MDISCELVDQKGTLNCSTKRRVELSTPDNVQVVEGRKVAPGEKKGAQPSAGERASPVSSAESASAGAVGGGPPGVLVKRVSANSGAKAAK